MPPESQDNIDNLLVQNENHHKETMEALDSLLLQGSETNPEPLLEAQIQIQNKIKESAEKQNELLKEIRDFSEQEKTVILRGHKGEPGKDGRNPLHVGDLPPEKPEKGDLWYQP